MDNIKDDRFYLEKVVTDLKFILDHTQGMTQAEMEENELLIDSIMFRIVQMAENGAKLSGRFARNTPIYRGQPFAACAIVSCIIMAL